MKFLVISHTFFHLSITLYLIGSNALFGMTEGKKEQPWLM
jgi:hypothetical protein